MLNLNQSAISHANNASQFDAGDVLAREAERVYTTGLAEMQAALPETPNDRQQAIFDARAADFRALVEKAYNDNISRRAAWVPWTVCGRSGYNAEKNNRKADAALAAAGEWSRKIAAFVENTAAMIRDAIPLQEMLDQYRTGKRRDPISADDPDAAAKLQARIEGMKDRHERKKRINAYWRKVGSLHGCPDVTAEEARKYDDAAQPFPAWSLQNGLAEIHRLEERLDAIRRAEAAGDAEQVYSGFTVTIARTAGRINIDFADKPEADARELLKKHGLHWSPREKVWTRKYTQNALYVVRSWLIPALLALPAYATETTHETATETAPANAPEMVQDAPAAPAGETPAPAPQPAPEAVQAAPAPRLVSLAELAALLTA